MNVFVSNDSTKNIVFQLMMHDQVVDPITIT